MNRAEETVITPFGKIPKWQDCKWCNKKLVCRFVQFAHLQPCEECRETERYQKNLDEQDKYKRGSIGQAFSNQQAAAVWEAHGRNFYTNAKGNIIKDEKYKPLGRGKVEKKKTYH